MKNIIERKLNTEKTEDVFLNIESVKISFKKVDKVDKVDKVKVDSFNESDNVTDSVQWKTISLVSQWARSGEEIVAQLFFFWMRIVHGSIMLAYLQLFNSFL